METQTKKWDTVSDLKFKLYFGSLLVRFSFFVSRSTSFDEQFLYLFSLHILCQFVQTLHYTTNIVVYIRGVFVPGTGQTSDDLKFKTVSGKMYSFD